MLDKVGLMSQRTVRLLRARSALLCFCDIVQNWTMVPNVLMRTQTIGLAHAHYGLIAFCLRERGLRTSQIVRLYNVSTPIFESRSSKMNFAITPKKPDFRVSRLWKVNPLARDFHPMLSQFHLRQIASGTGPIVHQLITTRHIH